MLYLQLCQKTKSKKEAGRELIVKILMYLNQHLLKFKECHIIAGLQSAKCLNRAKYYCLNSVLK